MPLSKLSIAKDYLALFYSLFDLQMAMVLTQVFYFFSLRKIQKSFSHFVTASYQSISIHGTVMIAHVVWGPNLIGLHFSAVLHIGKKMCLYGRDCQHTIVELSLIKPMTKNTFMLARNCHISKSKSPHLCKNFLASNVFFNCSYVCVFLLNERQTNFNHYFRTGITVCCICFILLVLLIMVHSLLEILGCFSQPMLLV